MPLPKSKPSYLLTRPVLSKSLPTQRPTRVKRQQKWVVFIDAGHGGKDPGAIGKAGTQEKVITLAAAQELARQLRETNKITPILARNDDRYLRLRQRINLARKSQADLFISLHAGFLIISAHGISVLPYRKRRQIRRQRFWHARKMADLIGGPDVALEDPDAAGALVRMFQESQ